MLTKVIGTICFNCMDPDMTEWMAHLSQAGDRVDLTFGWKDAEGRETKASFVGLNRGAIEEIVSSYHEEGDHE